MNIYIYIYIIYIIYIYIYIYIYIFIGPIQQIVGPVGGGQVHSFFIEIWGFQQSCFLIRFLFQIFNCFLCCGSLLCFFILVLRLLLQFAFSTSNAPPQPFLQLERSIVSHPFFFSIATSFGFQPAVSSFVFSPQYFEYRYLFHFVQCTFYCHLRICVRLIHFISIIISTSQGLLFYFFWFSMFSLTCYDAMCI